MDNDAAKIAVLTEYIRSQGRIAPSSDKLLGWSDLIAKSAHRAGILFKLLLLVLLFATAALVARLLNLPILPTTIALMLLRSFLGGFQGLQEMMRRSITRIGEENLERFVESCPKDPGGMFNGRTNTEGMN